MLVLSRRINEKIIIHDTITVTVLGIKGSQVKIGIDAPSDVTVHRDEIYERIQNERQRNAKREFRDEKN